VIAVSTRQDEVGTAERELAAMQRDLAGMLRRRSRLASLGLAVSKINHDLRNLLTTAQLFSDRLARLTDPTVQRFAPKLVRALERAISFCESTLSYGRVQEPPPTARLVPLDPLVEEVRETLGLDARYAGALDQRDRARPHGGRRSRPAVPRAGQYRAQRRAGAGGPRRADPPAATRSASPGCARARWW
jgi:signal transduction histidine kinase